VTYRLSWWP